MLADLRREVGVERVSLHGLNDAAVETLVAAVARHELDEALVALAHAIRREIELIAATSLARLWRAQGRRTEARTLLAPVYGWFTEGFDTGDLVAAKMFVERERRVAQTFSLGLQGELDSAGHHQALDADEHVHGAWYRIRPE